MRNTFLVRGVVGVSEGQPVGEVEIPVYPPSSAGTSDEGTIRPAGRGCDIV